ncbi:hypothetical protein [Algoriphagus sp. A40]|uniref:hypothetical protein n=1 Tax=Algoriphagus sp. A40 TaxID=1945863 RepID=UPI000985DE33|nr:hypothetical protein [Algoriphagus sp. A40]OOG73059.1 hypothetical protein B0E43_14130 [Algoriphagus sp. A40]
MSKDIRSRKAFMYSCEASFGKSNDLLALDYSKKAKNEIAQVILLRGYSNYLKFPNDDYFIEDNSYIEGPYDEDYKGTIKEFFEDRSKSISLKFASRVHYSSRVYFILADLIEKGYLFYAHPIWDRSKKAAFICRLTPLGTSLACSPNAIAREFPSPKKNSCFVIMSFSNDKRLQDYFRFGIKSAVELLGYECVRADEIEHNGRITDKVLEQLENSRFIIADLTEARPNCYYEFGYAHHAKKDIIPTIHSSSPIHFDLKDFNFIVYESASELQDRLFKRVQGTIGKIESEEVT